MDGTVTKLNAEKGEITLTGTMNNPGTVIMIVSDMGEILATVDVDETRVTQVKLGQTARVVVDAVGNQLGTAITSAGMAGRIVVFGMNANAREPIRQVEITEKSLAIFGTYITDFTFPEAIRLVESGRLVVEPMISAVLPLADAGRGFEQEDAYIAQIHVWIVLGQHVGN